ncbi:MAG: hypothetical protein ACYDEP_05105 [Acidimicrobiales bacterium]|jgi:phage shock protein A|nr:hypothetical protein [Actinomycetota bacterium]
MTEKHDEAELSRSAITTELTSLATSLSDLSNRLTKLAEDAQASGHEELANSLFGAEKSLVGAIRRLSRTSRSPG